MLIWINTHSLLIVNALDQLKFHLLNFLYVKSAVPRIWQIQILLCQISSTVSTNKSVQISRFWHLLCLWQQVHRNNLLHQTKLDLRLRLSKIIPLHYHQNEMWEVYPTNDWQTIQNKNIAPWRFVQTQNALGKLEQNFNLITSPIFFDL